MSSLNKTININPELFKISNNSGGTRKKKDPPKLKFKNPKEPTNKTSKNALLKYIKNHQEKNYKKLIENELTSSSTAATSPSRFATSSSSSNDDFNSEFDESLKFLINFSKENEQKNINNHHNKTIKHYENVSLHFPEELQISSTPLNLFDTHTQPTQPTLSTLSTLSPQQPHTTKEKPLYGCLKNGNLPTYRQYKYTLKQHDKHAPTPTPTPTATTTATTSHHKIPPHYMKMHEQFLTQKKPKHMLHFIKQKKTIKRTFQLGKSKIHPKVAVLISNKTVRNDISTKSQILKQMHISDIKKYLLKHGFIKVGSSAPNDVLRKMYESAIMICGEIQNHNPDNLLYNYLNDETLFSPS